MMNSSAPKNLIRTDLCDAQTAARFDHSFVRQMPADPSRHGYPRQVRNACFSHVQPTSVSAPRLLAWTDGVGDLLGLSRPSSPTGGAADVLGGNRVLDGMQPYAARYGGHQFGNWAGQLGDGRAMTLTEILNSSGDRYDLQLKGAGLTPYSRTADGRAVLRSSVREFLCSEAMHHLGVPTTRALSLVATGNSVVRDMFYDGNAAAEPGAIVCRVAPSFVRFGNFEILTWSDELAELKQLADYVITTHFPELGAPSPEVYAAWFDEICRRTAVMVTEWMRVGFVHGVMNTDNMSILGLTIDYGPYGWLEGYDLGWTPNTTDAEGRRYCFGRQPEIAQWNLLRLAGALSPLIPDRADLENGIRTYASVYADLTRRAMGDKLGLTDVDANDDSLVDDLVAALHEQETDMTLFFRRLADVPVSLSSEAMSERPDTLLSPLRRAFYADSPESGQHLLQWLPRYIARVKRNGQTAADSELRRQKMNSVNPKYVARNYLAQLAIDALTEGDASVINRLVTVLQKPYDEQPEHDALADRRPEWARHKAGCSALSCSS
jgi:serine/tyrosine/threonine adenylyltransferase